MWRYQALLPLLDEANKVTLGEGFTPMLTLSRLTGQYGLQSLVSTCCAMPLVATYDLRQPLPKRQHVALPSPAPLAR